MLGVIAVSIILLIGVPNDQFYNQNYPQSPDTAPQSSTNVIVQGYKVDKDGQPFNGSGAVININSQQVSPGTNPFIISVPTGTITASSTIPSGFVVYYSLCINCMDHPPSSFVMGSSLEIPMPISGYIDLWWKYSDQPIKKHLPTQIISGSTFTELANGGNIYAPCVLFEDGIYKMWYGGQATDGHGNIHYAQSLDGI